MPEYVQFKNGNAIKNLYNVGGQKLRSDYYRRITSITPLADGEVLNPVYNSTDYEYWGTAYIDNKEYAISKTYNSSSGNYTDNYTYSKAYTPEGYVTTLSNPQYYYFRKDHLGNNREVWLANTGATIQRTQYYPSGLPWAESTGQSVQNKKYNGKEFVEAHGYDTYDYGARGYYSAIMRFTSIDPLAESTPWQSPYAYANNNPIRNIDFMGMSTADLNNDDFIFDKKRDLKNLLPRFRFDDIKPPFDIPNDDLFPNKSGTVTIAGDEGKEKEKKSEDLPNVNDYKNGEQVVVNGNTYQLNNNHWVKLDGILIRKEINPVRIPGTFSNVSNNSYTYFYIDAAIERDNQIAITIKGIDVKGVIKGGFVGLLTKGKFAIKTGVTAFWTYYINATTGAYDLTKDMFEHDQEVERQRNK